MKIIDVQHLEKTFDHIHAVQDVSFHVNEGEFFAFLGSNGAGKSTTINILCTLLKADSGYVFINNYQLNKENLKIKESIGIVFQNHLLDDLLTVEENLMTRAALYYSSYQDIKNAVQKVMKEMEIEHYANRLYGTLSGGQKRCCDIARAIIHQPQILFLDEPTTGLDPQTRQHVWKTIMALHRKNHMTIFLTTHYMEEANHANYIVIMDEGKIVAQGSPLQLRQCYAKERLILYYQNQAFPKQIKLLPYPIEIHEDYIVIYLNHTTEAYDILKQFQKDIIDFEVIKGNIEDVFLKVTGKELKI